MTSACAGTRAAPARSARGARAARRGSRRAGPTVLRRDDAVGRHIVGLGEDRLRVDALDRVEVGPDRVDAEFRLEAGGGDTGEVRGCGQRRMTSLMAGRRAPRDATPPGRGRRLREPERLGGDAEFRGGRTERGLRRWRRRNRVPRGDEALRGTAALCPRPPDAARRARRDLRPRRALGRRQDDRDEDGQPARRLRLGRRAPRRHERAGARRDAAAAPHRLRDPAGRPLPAHDRGRERGGRPGTCSAGRRRGSASAWTSCST